MAITVHCFNRRAKRNATDETQAEKKQRLQGKRKDPGGSEISLKQYACKRFKIGQCDLGDSCRYSHNGQCTSKEEQTDEGTSDEKVNMEDDTAATSENKDECDGEKSPFRRHRSVEFQRQHSVTEAEHSLLF